MASTKVVSVAAGLRRRKEGLSSWEASGKPCLPLPVTASGSADLPSSAGARQVAEERAKRENVVFDGEFV